MKKIFDTLFKEYGPQGWWPVAPIGSCSGDPNTPVYGVKGKNDKQRLEIIFGAILTQNTSWKNVEKAICALNAEELINVDKILKIDEKQLAQIIRPSGYYNQKAKKLKDVCEFLKQHPMKEIEKLDVWQARKLLLSVNGIGPETADSILLYAFNKPIFVVDTYTKRLLLKRGMIKEDATYDDIQKLFLENLPPDAALFNEFHALIVRDFK